VRPAARAPARALDADSAGLYLLRAGTPRFATAFGVPRWLAERLTADPAPAPLTRALATARPCLFDPAAEEFPEPRATGQGVAVTLHGDPALLGVLVVVTRRDLRSRTPSAAGHPVDGSREANRGARRDTGCVSTRPLLGRPATRRAARGGSLAHSPPLLNAESNAADGASNTVRFTNSSASGAPTSRSIPASSHSIEMGPV
jgi:hypothetical protein